MAYFACMVGGSGKGNTVTVTCAEEFAGLTITLAKTGKTYRKACPSTAPYVVTFYGVENGTYTVSTTYGGETYSEIVVVQDISCALNYGFEWQTWVDTASQLDSSDYDSLDEVLADEKALRELFLEHACVDYMAESAMSNEALETIINDDYCAKWINLSDYALDYLYANEVIAALMDEADKYFYGEWVITDSTTTPPTWGPKGKVPLMTSNTAPYGTASARRAASGNEAYRAFNRDNSTTYYTSGAARDKNDYIAYTFKNPVCPKRVYIEKESHRLSDAAHVILKGSNNGGTTWVTLSEDIDVSSGYVYSVNVDVSDYYLTLALFNNDSGSSSYFALAELQFYGRELKLSIPAMTSNTAPYGEAFAKTQASDYQAWKAFDKSASTFWWNNNQGGINGNYIGYKFTTPFQAKMLIVRGYSVNTDAVKTFKLQGSNDNLTYTDLSGTLTIPMNTNPTYFDISSNTEWFTYYRLYVLSNYGGSYGANVTEIELFSKDYSEKEFESGITKKWLYDHGVELETLTITGTGTKNDDCIKLTAANAQASATIDTTDYSLMRGKVGSHASGTNQLLCGSGTSNFTASNMPNNNSLNVSNINGSNAVGVKQTANGVFDATEIWLE